MGSSFSQQDAIFMDEFLTRSRKNVEAYFPFWQNTGKIYMIPPAPVMKYQGPVDLRASGVDETNVAQNQPTIRGDSAEAKVFTFLAGSQQHAFVLQNFKTVGWKRIFKSRGYNLSSDLQKKMNEIGDMKFDVLILHAGGTIIAIECKAVETFQQKRYTECKKQLNKLDNFLSNAFELIAELGETSRNCTYEVQSRKVISFPMVEMEHRDRHTQNLPYNLGCQDLKNDPRPWWARLMLQSDNNFFESALGYQSLVLLLICMYSATELSIGKSIFNIDRIIRSQSFYDGSSSSAVIRRTPEELLIFEDFIFLNPDQHQVLACEDNRLVISGEVGTGKTILLVQKALIEMMAGQSVVFWSQNAFRLNLKL